MQETSENGRKYMCTSEKCGNVVDITFVPSLASAHVYCAINRKQGYECKVHDMSHVNRRIVLTDEPDAKKLAPVTKWARKVRCIETGETWETVTEFQKHIGMRRWALETKIRKHLPIDGKTYEYIDEPKHHDDE